MKLLQRLIPQDADFHRQVLFEIEKHPGCCDVVWLTGCCGFPPLEQHRRAAAQLAPVADMYRAAGLSVAYQVANTLGHGYNSFAADYTGLLFPGSPVRTMIGPGGEDAERAFCPRDLFLRDYLCRAVACYAVLKPDYIWIDDDFRLPNHMPVAFGCFCSGCLTAFNAQYDADFTREALVREVLHGSVEWRSRWLTFQRQGMADLMSAVVTAFCAISPDTVWGQQHALPGGYIMGDHLYAFEPMYRISGKAPLSRPGGGSYSDHDPNSFIDKGIEVALQNAALPPYVKEIAPEIENLPCAAFGKTSDGTAFETSYYLAVGATDMSYSMIYGNAEPIPFYGRFFARFAAQRAYWERLSDANRHSRPAGLAYFVSRDWWQRDLLPEEGFAELHGPRHIGADKLMRDTVPIHFESKNAAVYLLHPEEAVGLSQADIDFLLTRPVVTSGEAVAALQARGVDLGVTATAIPAATALFLCERYTDHPLNRGKTGYAVSPYIKGRNDCCFLTDCTGSATVLGTYATGIAETLLTGAPDLPLGASADLLVTTKQGGRWAVLGYQPWKYVVTQARIERFLDIAEAVAGAPLCARILTPHQAVLHPRSDESGRTVCVSVTNCTIGKCDGAELLIRDPHGSRFVWMSQQHAPTVLQARRQGDAYVLPLPTLDAWTVGTVFCEI